MACCKHLLILVSALLAVIGQNVAEIPKITGSFAATAEMTIDVKFGGKAPVVVPTMLVFHEIYEYSRKMSASYVETSLQLSKILEMHGANRTYSYTCLEAIYDPHAKCKTSCKVLTAETWANTSNVAGLSGYRTDNGHIVLPLRQLLMLDDSALVSDKSRNLTYRNIPAQQWVYVYNVTLPNKQTEQTTVRSTWTNRNWAMSGIGGPQPLGFNIERHIFNKTEAGTTIVHEDYVNINVLHFVQDNVDEQELEFVPGVVCPNLPELPKPDFSQVAAVTYGVEMVLPDGDYALNSEFYLDAEEKVMRVLMDPVLGASINVETAPHQHAVTKESVDMQLFLNKGVVFIKDNLKGSNCIIQPIANFSYAADPQIFFNIKDVDKWNFRSLVGITSEFNALGLAHRRDVSTLMYQSLRNDWPVHGVESLWEWYFLESKNIYEPGPKLPFVSADVSIIGVVKDQTFGPFYTEGQRMTFNFYDVMHTNRYYLHSRVFDVASCYSANHKEMLMFQVKFEGLTKEVASSAVTDDEFLYIWKKAITSFAGLDEYSYRVAQLRAIFDDPPNIAPKLFIIFTLLDKHPDLPKPWDASEITLDAARRALQKAVDAQSSTYYKNVKLGAVPGTLQELFEKPIVIPTGEPRTEQPKTESPKTDGPKTDGPKTESPKTNEPHTPPPKTNEPHTPPPKTNEPTHTLPPDGTTVEIEIEKRKDEFLHPPGTMAGVAIAMLVVGLSIGAGGVYLKAKVFDRSTV